MQTKPSATVRPIRTSRQYTRREVHNNVVQWREAAVRNRTLNTPPAIPPGEGNGKLVVSQRVENACIGLVVLAAFFIGAARLLGLL